MKTTLGQIHLPGRVRLEFTEQGERGGLPFIALQGVNDSWRSFEPVLPAARPAGRAMHWGEPQRFALDLVQFAQSVAVDAATA